MTSHSMLEAEDDGLLRFDGISIVADASVHDFFNGNSVKELLFFEHLSLLRIVLVDGSAIDVSNITSSVDFNATALLKRGMVGLSGKNGKNGKVALDGKQGIQGDAGSRGTIGLPGLRGLDGIVGLVGNTGPEGLAGQSGPKGLKGKKGPTGKLGNMGDTGVAGLASAIESHVAPDISKYVDGVIPIWIG